jgi:hypothetical protein
VSWSATKAPTYDQVGAFSLLSVTFGWSVRVVCRASGGTAGEVRVGVARRGSQCRRLPIRRGDLSAPGGDPNRSLELVATSSFP